ncbi:hypothetical protein D3C87_1689530 [compost metagenome]|uniref:Phosphoribosylpyrophosphate synthetase n=1 Tax=Pedobacter nyackensis TaxID=475255 RepID=A0A1W2DWY2_9SPHI|nr:phosphoribosylpyrophosphate synthetase [Pedobacter nyackensis]SMD01817.1 hypothetical protein SAMN04488101_108219 [Pedobacter nyackensis]
MKSYETVSEAINDLFDLGYTKDFNIATDEDCLICSKTGLSLSPDEFQIDEVYRFEGETDPGDEMVIFAISSKVLSVGGVLVNAYGVYADEHAWKVVQRLKKYV